MMIYQVKYISGKKMALSFRYPTLWSVVITTLEAGLSNGSRLSVKLEGTAFTKEYVTARLYESSHIQGCFDSKVGYPVVQNIYDTGRYV